MKLVSTSPFNSMAGLVCNHVKMLDQKALSYHITMLCIEKYKIMRMGRLELAPHPNSQPVSIVLYCIVLYCINQKFPKIAYSSIGYYNVQNRTKCFLNEALNDAQVLYIGLTMGLGTCWSTLSQHPEGRSKI